MAIEIVDGAFLRTFLAEKSRFFDTYIRVLLFINQVKLKLVVTKLRLVIIGTLSIYHLISPILLYYFIVFLLNIPYFFIFPIF